MMNGTRHGLFGCKIPIMWQMNEPSNSPKVVIGGLFGENNTLGFY